MTEARRFVFSPLEHRGGLVGLRAGQVGVLGGGLLAVMVVLRAAPDGTGAAAAALVVLASVALAFAPVGGRPAEEWLPLAARHASRVLLGAHRARPRPGPGVLLPPACLRGVDITTVERPGETPIAVVRDRSAATQTAVIAVRGRSFALLDAVEKERRLAAWATILSGLSREGGPIRSIQWVQRTVPGDATALARHFDTGRVLPPDSAPARSYASLITTAGPAGEDHESFVAVSVRDRRARGGADLLREVRLLEGQLRSADLEVDGVLTPRELGGVIRSAFDPEARAALRRRAAMHPDLAGCPPESAWPAGTDLAWAWWRADRMWNATFWIAEWPRTEVGADFLTPLLLQGAGHRTVSVIMAPLPPSAGVREAEAARTAQAADEQIRQRAGYMPTARRHRQAEGIARREAELADGHAAYRFSGYVSVSAASPEELDTACSEVVHAAHQCRLDLRRLYGLQDAAFTWTLPLGRGIGGRR